MTISSTTNRVSFSGNNVTTAFSFPYRFLADADLVVIETVITTGVQTTKTLTTHYTVSGAGDAAGGAVTMLTAPASTVTLTIYRDPAATQAVDLVENDPLPVEDSIETPLDKLTMMVQRLKDVDSRSLRQPEGDTANIDFLPAKVTRASMYLAFDADGDPIASSATDGVVASTFMETVLDDTTAAGARATLDAQEDVVTTTGDTVVGVAGVAARLAIGTASHVLTSDGTTAAWLVVPLPRSYLAGFTLSNNVTDATNDIDITAGAARDSTNAANIIGAAMTKLLDANWAAGTGNGLRNSAAAITDTTYHIYAVAKALGADQDYYAHTSATVATVLTALQAETGGADYLYVRRIGSIIRASAAIIAFKQAGNRFLRNAIATDINATNPGTSAVSATLSVPTGIVVDALVHLTLDPVTGTALSARLSSLDVSDEAPSPSTSNETDRTLNNAAAVVSSGPWPVRTNTSAQIRYRISVSGGGQVVRIGTAGWIDTRGRYD